MEIVSGVAMFSGPLVGGIFYMIGENTPIGGYQLPYYVLCLSYILIIPLLIYELKVEVRINIIIARNWIDNYYSWNWTK